MKVFQGFLMQGVCIMKDVDFAPAVTCMDTVCYPADKKIFLSQC